MTKEYDIEGRNPEELEPYYCRHVSAMTTEGLHSKSDIACELAFRDKRIAELEANAKPYGYISSMCDRDISKGNTCPLYPARDEDAGYTIPLFTTAKPVPDHRAESAEAAASEMVPVTIDSGVIRDANRYRFLRDEDAWGEDSDSWDVETRTGLISSENLMELRLDHFDAAIDARMAASDIPFLNPANAPQKPVSR